MAVFGGKLVSWLLNMIWKISHTKKTMHDIVVAPKGSFFVYVGEGHKKYAVPIRLSSSLSFKGLLEKYEEEIQASGPLALPSCSTIEFEAILKCAEADQKNGVREEIVKMGLLFW